MGDRFTMTVETPGMMAALARAEVSFSDTARNDMERWRLSAQEIHAIQMEIATAPLHPEDAVAGHARVRRVGGVEVVYTVSAAMP